MDKNKIILDDPTYLRYLGLRNKLWSTGKKKSGSVIHKYLEEYEEMKGDKYRIGYWEVMPVSHKRFWLFDPREDEFTIEDIAFTLSRINRYNGRTVSEIPYSVGQHSIYCSAYIDDARYALRALLHDAQEAFCQDIVTPIKKMLGKTYSDFEDSMESVIARKFNLEWDVESRKIVKNIDIRMYVSEMEDLLPLGNIQNHWNSYERIPHKIIPWYPRQVYQTFLWAYHSCQTQQNIPLDLV